MRISYRNVVCGLLLVGVAAISSAAADQPMIGEAAPGFELRSLSGSSVRLEDYRGKPLVIHFGAGW